MINAKSTDYIRIEVDEPNGRSVTLTGEQWLELFDCNKLLTKRIERLEDQVYAEGGVPL